MANLCNSAAPIAKSSFFFAHFRLHDIFVGGGCSIFPSNALHFTTAGRHYGKPPRDDKSAVENIFVFSLAKAGFIAMGGSMHAPVDQKGQL